MAFFSRSLRLRANPVLSRAARAYASPAALARSHLRVTPRAEPQQKPANKDLVFGKFPSDHMLVADWTQAGGWAAPEIKANEPFLIDPSALVLHYAMECFEGMKAYKDAQGRVRLFRPMMNMERMNRSSARVALPTFDGEEYLECIKELLRVDESWVPSERGYSLYIRPTHIATQAVLGVQKSTSSRLYTVTCPVGPYYPSGFKPVSLYADDKNARAWPGGVGQYKIGGNYAPAIQVAQEVIAKGYQQVLWLHEEKLTEVGTMNLFVYLEKKDGGRELVTAPLDGTILPGVTRDSVLQLTKDWGVGEVSEREISIHEVIEAKQEGRLLEAFGAGTACVIAPIKCIHFKGVDYDVPLDKDDDSALAGPLANRLNDHILGIQYGEIESDWSVVV